MTAYNPLTRKKHLIVVFLFGIFIFLAGCEVTQPRTLETPTAIPIFERDAPVPVITLERGPCFISCPAYLLELYQDGAIVYSNTGDGTVAKQQRAQITVDQVQGLLIAFAELESELQEPPPQSGDYATPDWNAIRAVISEQDESNLDGPKTYLCFVNLGIRKCAGTFGKSSKLLELAQQIDDVTNSARWTHQ